VAGVLAPPDRLGDALADVLTDDQRRRALAAGAVTRARTLTWDASALGILRVFHRAVLARTG
jgi:glycosyltransferase involved in cell wall biosynthesis